MNDRDYVPRNNVTTLLLARLLLELPVAWVLSAPLAEVRGRAHHQARTLRALRAAGLLDTDGHTATEGLLMLEGRMRGTASFRDELISAIGFIAADLAARVGDLGPASAPSWPAASGHIADCDPFGVCDANCQT